MKTGMSALRRLSALPIFVRSRRIPPCLTKQGLPTRYERPAVTGTNQVVGAAASGALDLLRHLLAVHRPRDFHHAALPLFSLPHAALSFRRGGHSHAGRNSLS